MNGRGEGGSLPPVRQAWTRLILGWAALVACGGNEAPAATPAGAASAAADAGADAGPASAPPFAGSVAEATTMISNVVDERRGAIQACVREFRARKKLAQERVSVSFGIDQEGKLLGVTSKGKEDPELKSCVQAAVRGAPFPRSHAGVITITKTYEELVIP